jgi:predicted lipoprotein with Yx(FWY)xxD motif
VTGGRLRRRPTFVVPAALVLSSLIFAACANGGNVTTLSAPPTTDPSLTLTLQKSPAGPILATGGGDTLYDFAPDTPTRSACVDDGCVLQWPPLLVHGPVRVQKGINPSLVGTLRRPDGATQLSYGGHPLYTYILDVTPGMVTGQAIDQNGGLWHVLGPRGKQITTSFSVESPNQNG